MPVHSSRPSRRRSASATLARAALALAVVAAGVWQLSGTSTANEDQGVTSPDQASQVVDPAVDFVVINSTGDLSDANVGDSVCWTGATLGDGRRECTLRAAIEESNAEPILRNVFFDIPTSDAGYSSGSVSWSLRPQSPLPTISAAINLQARSQPEWGSTRRPVIHLDGSLAGTGATGLDVGSDRVTISGLAVTGFDADGISIGAYDNVTVLSSYIGVAPDGVTRAGNRLSGIAVVNATRTRIGSPGNGNLIVANAASGIQVSGSASTVIEANLVASSGASGIRIEPAATHSTTVLGNTIRDNGLLAIDFNADGVTANDQPDNDGVTNYPRIISATRSTTSSTVTVTYEMYSTRGGAYLIEIFRSPSGADPSGFGEAENFVTSSRVDHDGLGWQTFTQTYNGPSSGSVSLTSTSLLDGGAYVSTSEMSEAEIVILEARPTTTTGPPTTAPATTTAPTTTIQPTTAPPTSTTTSPPRPPASTTTTTRPLVPVTPETTEAPPALAFEDPVANDDDIAVPYGLPAPLDVLLNDTGEGQKISSFSQPGVGTITLVDGVPWFDPPDDFVGSTSFTYTVTDAFGVESTATVRVTVEAPTLSDLSNSITIDLWQFEEEEAAAEALSFTDAGAALVEAVGALQVPRRLVAVSGAWVLLFAIVVGKFTKPWRFALVTRVDRGSTARTHVGPRGLPSFGFRHDAELVWQSGRRYWRNGAWHRKVETPVGKRLLRDDMTTGMVDAYLEETPEAS